MSPTALLFPGQGSQEPGMGRDLAESDSDIMQLWKKAERISNLPLRAICWEDGDGELSDTRNLQPALTVVNLALWQKLSSRLTPMAAAGHSLGEYSALCAAGVLSLDTVLELVALRARLMSDADPGGKGAMAAVLKLSLPQVKECVAQSAAATGEPLVVANYNTPGQLVISGTLAAISHAQEGIKAAKGRAVPLPVSGAFHSPLMQEAAAELAKVIEGKGKAAWSKARFPVYSNAEPKPETDPDILRQRLLRQMTSSVYWIDIITAQWDAGARTFVECGPKGVLGKMVGPILQEHAPAAALHSAEAPAWNTINVGNRQQLREFA